MVARRLLHPDEQTIQQVLAGDSGLYGELVQRYQGSVYRLAYRMLNRAENAEDVVQTAFVQAYVKLAECRDRKLFGAWVRKMAVNLCVAKLPREIPSGQIEDMRDVGAGLDDPVLEEVIRRMEREHVQALIARLPADYRIALILRYEEGLSFNEIAGLLGEPARRLLVWMLQPKWPPAITVCISYSCILRHLGRHQAYGARECPWNHSPTAGRPVNQ